MMAEAKQAATKSMTEINGKLQLANLAAEDRDHLDAAYRTLEIEYVQLEAGEAAFIAAAARGEIDPTEIGSSEARYIVGCPNRRRKACHAPSMRQLRRSSRRA